MALFGGSTKQAKEAASAAKVGKKFGKGRSGQPSSSAAGSRDYPPKVDIYATSTCQTSSSGAPPPKAPAADDFEDEKKDDGGGGTAASHSRQAGGGGGGHGHGLSSSQSSAGGSRLSRTSTGNNANSSNILNPQLSPHRSAPLLANPAASPPPPAAAAAAEPVQVPGRLQFAAPAPPSSSPRSDRYQQHPLPAQQQQQHQPRIGIKVAPVIEFPVDASGAAVSGNDASSLVSSLGADETAVVARPPQPPVAAVAARKWPSSQPMSPPLSPSNPPQQQQQPLLDRGAVQNRYLSASAAGAAGTPPQMSSQAFAPTPSTNGWMERAVEARVQSRLAAMEARVEGQLRKATAHMEQQVAGRLAALEDRIAALLLQGQQQQQQQAPQQPSQPQPQAPSQPPPLQRSGDLSNPPRGTGWNGAGRIGW
jgi:hypothetical protein